MRNVMILLALVAMIFGPVSAYAMPHGATSAPEVAAPHGPLPASADCAHAHGGHAGVAAAAADVPCMGDAGPCMDANGCRHAACTFAMPVLTTPAASVPVPKLPAEPVALARLAGREVDPPLDPPKHRS